MNSHFQSETDIGSSLSLDFFDMSLLLTSIKTLVCRQPLGRGDKKIRARVIEEIIERSRGGMGNACSYGCGASFDHNINDKLNHEASKSN